MKIILLVLSLSLIPILETGCVRQVIAVQTNSVMKTGPDVTGHFYVKKDGKWTLSSNKIKVPEGMYIHNCDDCE